MTPEIAATLRECIAIMQSGTVKMEDLEAVADLIERAEALAEDGKSAPEKSDLQILSEEATSGIWGQFSPMHGPWKAEAMAAYRACSVDALDTSHHISTVREDGTPYRLASFHHASDAAFAEALVNAYRAGELAPLPDPKQGDPS